MMQEDPQVKSIYLTETVKWQLAQLILDLREEMGLSQTAFAKFVGKSRSTIARIETGTMEPSFSTLMDIAAALNKSITITISDNLLVEKNQLATKKI